MCYRGIVDVKNRLYVFAKKTPKNKKEIFELELEFIICHRVTFNIDNSFTTIATNFF
jgi:hypothetical protein